MICRRVTEIGKILTDVFAVSVTKKVWEKLLEELIDHSEFELLMIDASHFESLSCINTLLRK